MSIKLYRQRYTEAAAFVLYKGDPWKVLRKVVEAMQTLPEAQRLAFGEKEFLANPAFNPACVGKTKITDEINVMAMWETTKYLKEVTSLLPKAQRPKFAKTFFQSHGAYHLTEEQLAQYVKHVIGSISHAQVKPLLENLTKAQPQAAMRGFYAGIDALQGRKKAELIDFVLESDLYKTPEKYIDSKVAQFNVFMCSHLPQVERPAFIEQNFFKSKQFNARDVCTYPSSASPVNVLIEALATLTPTQREASLKNGFLTNYAGNGLRDQNDRLPTIVNIFCDVSSCEFDVYTPEVRAAATQAYWVMQDTVGVFRPDLFRARANLPVLDNA